MSVQLTKFSKQICKILPEDILIFILDFDGRWRKGENGKWISIFHMSDDRYWMLDNMIRWQQLNKYDYVNSGRRGYPHADRIGFIFPVVNEEYDTEDTDIEWYKKSIRYIHIDKIIVYDRRFDSEKRKTVYTSKFNIMRAFTSQISTHMDSSESYSSDEDNDGEHIFGEYDAEYEEYYKKTHK